MTVGEIASRQRNALVGGPFGSDLGSADYIAAGVPVIRGQNLSVGRFVGGDFVFVSEEKADRLRSNLAHPGDLVFTQRGNTVLNGGQVAIVPPGPYDRYVVSQSQMKLTPDASRANTRYLFYVFSSSNHKTYLRNNAIATGVPHTNLGLLRDFEFSLPPLSDQQAIAGMLGALDDKIELNRRMNQTLEEIARTIFTSWFVRFDPVRAKADGRQPDGMDAATAALFPDSFVDSDLGPIPAGWKSATLGDVAINTRNGVRPGESANDTPYIALEHMSRGSIALDDWGTAEGVVSGKFRFQLDSILFGKLRPYFHKVGVAPVEGICSTDILVIEPKEPHWFSFLLEHVSSKELIAHTDAASTGTKMPRASWSDLARFQVALPPQNLAAHFNLVVRPMLAMIVSSIHESRTLAALRNALLPKLLSGELRVQEAKELVGSSV